MPGEGPLLCRRGLLIGIFPRGPWPLLTFFLRPPILSTLDISSASTLVAEAMLDDSGEWRRRGALAPDTCGLPDPAGALRRRAAWLRHHARGRGKHAGAASHWPRHALSLHQADARAGTHCRDRGAARSGAG